MNTSTLELTLTHLEFSNTDVLGATKKAIVVEPTLTSNAPGGLREVFSVEEIQILGFESGSRLKSFFQAA